MTRIHRDHAAVEGNEINITPMLDVVFILLIFFIVTASFQTESALALSRPAATSGHDAAGQVWVVRIDGLDRVSVNQRSIDPQALAAVTLQWLSSRDDEAADRQAVIVSSALASTGMLVQVADQLREAGLDRISVRRARP